MTKHITDEYRGDGRFHLRRRIGSGGFGIVYEAFDARRNAVVALKTLRAFDPAALQNFKHEFRALADVDHVHLVSLYELFGEDDDWFFTMELVDGVPLADYVWNEPRGVRGTSQDNSGDSPTMTSDAPESDNGAPPLSRHGSTFITTADRLARLRSVTKQLAEGVCAIHQAGILHRDIKPSNVLVTPDGSVVLLDFGLATELSGSESESQVVGTPAYMSPEQASRRPVGEASDWYSVGVMLYEGLTGQTPFRGTTSEMLLSKQQAEPPPPRSIADDVPADLDGLCQDLLRLDPSQRPSASDVLRRLTGGAEAGREAPTGGTDRGAVSALVGRDRQIQDLLDAYRRTAREEAVVVCVEGRSGMGKSTLARRFLRTVRERDPHTMVLTGRCYEQESVPYKAIDGVIDELTQWLVRLGPREATALLPRNILALARLFPVLRRVGAIAAMADQAPAADSLEVRRRAFAALRELLHTLVKRHRVVLFIDDLHWGDLDSASLLAELLRSPDPPPVLFVLAYRSEDRDTSVALSALLSTLQSAAPGRHVLNVPVAELSVPDARSLASALLDDGRASVSHADAIALESGGSPFFVETLARYAVQTGDVASLGDVLGARVAQLSIDARRLLELVSLNSRPLDFEVGKDAATWQADPQATLRQLRSLHLVRTRSNAEFTAVEPYHDRIRETIVRALDRDTRRVHHVRLAKAWEASGRADPELLATHYEGAGQTDRAAEHAERAAALADEALAFDRAARLYRWVLSLRPDDADALQEIYVKLAKALANTGKGQQAAEAYLRAAASASDGDLIEFERLAAEQFLRVGDIDHGLAVMGRVLDRVGVTLPKTPLSALPSLLANRAYLAVRGYGFHERPASAIAPAVLRKIDTYRSAIVGMQFVDPVRGGAYHCRALLLALKTGEPIRVGRALCGQVSTVAQPGGRRRFAEMEALQRRSMEIADRLDNDYLRGFSTIAVGVGLGFLGDHKASLARLEDGTTILRDRCVGAIWETQGARVWMTESLFWQGEWAEVLRRLPGYLQICEETGDRLTAANMQARVQPFTLLFGNQPGQAREAAQAAIAQWSKQAFHMPHFYEMFAQLYIDLYQQDANTGFERLAHVRRAVSRSLLLKVQKFRVEFRSVRGRLGLIAAAQGQMERLRVAEEEARGLDGEDIPWADGLAGLLRASVAATRGQRDQAVQLLTVAERQLDACHMNAFVAAARWRRGEVIGGDEGRDLVQSSTRWLADQQVADPARMTNMLTPGRWH